MSDTNTNTPSLEELVYYMEEGSSDDLSQPRTPDLGVDPTEDPVETDEPIEETNEAIEDDPELIDSLEPKETEESDPEPEPVTEVEPEPQDPPEESESEESIYDQFYSVLTSEGILSSPEDFEFDGTPEKLQEALDYTKQELQFSIAKGLWEKLPEDFRNILDYGLAGGSDLNQFLQSRQQLSLDNVDLENASHQREVMRKYFSETTKYDESRIERMIDKLSVAGSLQEDAAEALDDLQEIVKQREQEAIEQQKQLAQQQQEQAHELRQQMFEVVDNTEYINTNRKGKVKAFLLNPVTRNQETNTDFNRALNALYSNPEHLVQLADLLLDYDPKSGLNLERFQKASKTSAAKKLKEKLESIESVKSKVSGKGSKVSRSSFDWEEFLRQN